jgi:hypothetical protein
MEDVRKECLFRLDNLKRQVERELVVSLLEGNLFEMSELGNSSLERDVPCGIIPLMDDGQASDVWQVQENLIYRPIAIIEAFCHRDGEIADKSSKFWCALH